MNLSPRIIFVSTLSGGLLLLGSSSAAAWQPPGQPPASGETPVAPPVSPAVRSATGAPSPGAAFSPRSAAEPGSRRRSAPSASEGGAFGSTATTVAPDGSLLSGLQIYDPNLAPTEPGYADDAPDYHIVQGGDTLWDISGYYLVDPYLWPKLWSWNEHVTNAHWIFPGDRIRLYDPLIGRRRDKGPDIEYKRTQLPRGRGEGTYMLNQVAFVDASDFETSMKVSGGGDAKVMMSTLDTVYMSYDNGNPPIPGERLVVYSPTREVRDPDGKKVLGYIVQLMGEVEIETVARKAAEGTITKAINPVERGYRVGPLRRVYRRIETKEATASATGVIAAALTGTGPTNIKMKKTRKSLPLETLAGDQQFVIINLGASSGVEVGNVLRVIRKGDEYTTKRVFNIPYEEGWPRRVTGALLVVEVQENMSLAAVVFSRRELEQGDHVELQGPELRGDDTTDDGGAKPSANVNAERDGNSAKADGGFKFGK
ncbi:MAG: LysM peptidoglycan-binding domain-containing protein [Nannocystaceae bacterium]|nr:LysM peptidoglycan-binding domain-containing protein [Nannocystaceae bacterium]